MRQGGPVRDEDLRRNWLAIHSYCQCCGMPGQEAARYPIGLACHHLVKRGRSDEACNFLCLCMVCHASAELIPTTLPGGGKSPVLTLDASLTIKRYREPEEFCVERLMEIAQRDLFQMDFVPLYFEESYRRRRPNDRERFVPNDFVYPEPERI